MSAALFKRLLHDLRPPDELTVSEWAERNRVLTSAEGAAEPGEWRNSKTPYLVEIMDAMGDPRRRGVVFRKPSQIGGTEVELNFLGYRIDQQPGPTMVVYPTEALAKSVSRNRIQAMINACPSLSRWKTSREDDFGLLEMRLQTMTLNIAGANSPATLSSRPEEVVIFDEAGKFPTWTGKEADPISLAMERQKTFPQSAKTIIVSTPTVAGDTMDQYLQRCDEIRDYHGRCPHCGHPQVLVFAQVRWPKELQRDDVRYTEHVRALAWYECERCKDRIENHHRSAMLAAGAWVPRVANPGALWIGFDRLSSLCSPWQRWGDTAAEFLVSKDYRPKLMNWTNSWMGENWKETVETREGINLLERRGTLPRRHAPADALAFTAGIDVQRYGFWFAVWAWSKALGSWCVDHGELTTWDQVQSLIFDTDFFIDGQPRRIWRAGIDTGGGRAHDSDTGEARDWSRTAEAYAWLRENGRGIAWGTKGMSRNSDGRMIRKSVIDRMPGKSGEAIPGGLVLHFLDTDQLNELFDWRMRQTGAQRMNFHADAGADLFDHLTAIEKHRGRDGKQVWKATRPEHLRDCSMIAAACADQQWDGGIPLLAAAIEAEALRAAQRARPVPGGDGGAPGWVGGGSGWIR